MDMERKPQASIIPKRQLSYSINKIIENDQSRDLLRRETVIGGLYYTDEIDGKTEVCRIKRSYTLNVTTLSKAASKPFSFSLVSGPVDVSEFPYFALKTKENQSAHEEITSNDNAQKFTLRLDTFNDSVDRIRSEFYAYINQHQIIDSTLENRFESWLNNEDSESAKESYRLAVAESRYWPVNRVLSAQEIDTYLRASGLDMAIGLSHAAFNIRIIARPVVHNGSFNHGAPFETGYMHPDDILAGYRVSVQIEPAADIDTPESDGRLPTPFPGLVYEAKTLLRKISMQVVTEDESLTLIPASILRAAAFLDLRDHPLAMDWREGDTIISRHEADLFEKTQVIMEAIDADLKTLDLLSNTTKMVERFIFTLYEYMDEKNGKNGNNSRVMHGCIKNLFLFLNRAVSDATVLGDRLIINDLEELSTLMRKKFQLHGISVNDEVDGAHDDSSLNFSC